MKHNSKAIQILPMTPETVGAVAEIEQECFSSPWSYDAFWNELFNPNALTYTAVAQDGSVVGFLNAGFVLDEGSLNNIAVAEAYRQNGIGRLLLEAALSYCAVHGIRRFMLEVRVSNTPAIRLYEAFGFQPVGKRKNFYTLPTEDALLMTKEIEQVTEKECERK